MDRYWEQFKTPFLCFAGFSGVGKTTLLTHLIKRLRADNVRVGYYKHDSHRFTMDYEGKDTWLCEQAGAAMVTINDPRHFGVIGGGEFKKITISHALEQCDCILIEGYKQSPFAKVVFVDADGKPPVPADTPHIKAIVHQGKLSEWTAGPLQTPVFHRDDVDGIYRFVKEFFQGCASPLCGAVFVGGQSSRMGRPKFSLAYNGQTETERLARLLGECCVKVCISARADLDMGGLAHLPGCERVDDEHIGLGPVGGLATLMSRFPQSAWLITACDMPFLQPENLAALLRERNPLKYGTCYLKKGSMGYEPMCAIYEPKFIFPLFEAMSRRELSLSRIICDLPFQFIKMADENRYVFTNVNCPEEYESARRQRELEKARH